jgi:hypothetical protein
MVDVNKSQENHNDEGMEDLNFGTGTYSLHNSLHFTF